MTLRSLTDEITATKQRLVGDYDRLKSSPSLAIEAQYVWKALQITGKKEIILMVCQKGESNLGQTLWATLNYRGCQPSEWSSFLSALLEHLDDRSKCDVQSFLARGRVDWVHPTVRQRFWADLMILIREAQSDPAKQHRVWQAHCSDKHSYFEDPSGSVLFNTVYSGYLCGRFTSESETGKWGQSVTVKRGEEVPVAVWLAPHNQEDVYADHIACWQGRLQPEISVRFSVDETNGIIATPRSRAATFAVWDESPHINFKIVAPRKPGLHTVWVEVSENNKKLSSLPLDLTVVE